MSAMMSPAIFGPALILALILALLPWHIEGSSVVVAMIFAGTWWLAATPVALLVGVGATLLPRGSNRAWCLLVAGFAALLALLGQGFLVRHDGNAWPGLLGTARQSGLGWGGWLALALGLWFVARGVAERGAFRGDPFLAGSILFTAAGLLIFVFFPLALMFAQAPLGPSGLDLPRFAARLGGADIWSLACISDATRCGTVWNTLFLGVLTGLLATAIGLAFALLAVRAGRGWRRGLAVLAILPVITPPFVISLALIVLFGRTGVVTVALDEWLDIPRSRWIYGLPGLLISQLLSQVPIAYLVLVGVLEGVSPTLEEAARTLMASRWHVFRTVTWPLLRPGIAASFLLGFVESLSDFGNPLVLGGNFEVLSVAIFFAVVGAQHDPSKAATLALLLLALTFAGFMAQRSWVGRASFITVTGKGDGGIGVPLASRVRAIAAIVAVPWAFFTFVVYGIVMVGGFVTDIGRGDMTFTWRHVLTAFELEWRNAHAGVASLAFTGAAWDSLFTTLQVAAVAAPITAALGILAAWLITRTDFPGRRALEFAALLSFAVPGTVIGVSYIVAFNVPPFELTGTAAILVLCLAFRNMPVGMRAAQAALAQIDRSLEEASSVLGAGAARTLARIVLPLLRPAILTAMVYGFVQAMTAVSAVIFLVSARHNLATTYIVGRVEAGEYALAITYSAALIFIMLVSIMGIAMMTGQRKLGRRGG
jgi:iron(III) transport system permease protein